MQSSIQSSSPSRSRANRLVLIIAVLVAAGGVAFLIVRDRLFGRSATTQPSTRPTTQLAASQPSTQPKAPTDYLGVIRDHYPDYPATQPLNRPLALRDAGQFLIPDPVHLDPHRGVLFITRADAPTTDELYDPKTRPPINRRQFVLTREHVLYAHWGLDAEQADWQLHLVVPGDKAGTFNLVSRSSRQPLGSASDYDWPRAFSFQQRIYVPTRHGLSVFTISPGSMENRRRGEVPPPIITETRSPPLAEGDGPHAPVQVQLDLRGVLAWIPPQGDHRGSTGAIRFVEDQWLRLEGAAWPNSLAHLIPLPDGNCMQVLDTGNGEARLAIVSLDPVKVDERKIAQLILNLSDPDIEVRDKAYTELANYGPGAWPIAERMLEGEPEETKARLRDLLRAKVQPFLGGLQLNGRKLSVITRNSDGSVVLHAPDGVTRPRGNNEPQVIAPAFLHVRRGPFIYPLDQELVHEFNPARQKLTSYADEWLVIDDLLGPRRYFTGTLYPMLRKDQRHFIHFLGIDGAGRYLFRQPDTDTPTLIIDPYLADPVPRLPIWHTAGTSVGWDKDNWPVLQTATTGAIGRDRFRGMDPAKDRFFSKPNEVPPVPAYAPKASATRPTTQNADTQPASRPSMELTPEEAARPLLAHADHWYFGGQTSLKVAQPDGAVIEWMLPPTAAGSDNFKPWLVRTSDGILFLYNRPGAMHRIRPTPGRSEPFKLETTYTRRVPNTPTPTRVWVDPFDRICIVWNGTDVAILFPAGYIPPETRTMIPQSEQDDMLDE